MVARRTESSLLLYITSSNWQQLHASSGNPVPVENRRVSQNWWISF